ncbi:MAG TPA: carboxypeptidase regulatory-like domain-containing protein [Vicinamibacteria bacterium]|nr:carboxypeptidase regulatory-like domain-containing protein [Vicinamibacteria bacterium]
MHLLVWLSLVVQAEGVSAFRGTVQDESGRPVEGAIVAVSPGNVRYDAPAASATTDANGVFSVALSGRPPFTVAAHAPGFAPFRARDVPVEKPLHIVLERGGSSLSGRVLDGDTLEPIAGAVVESRAVAASGRLEDHPRFGLVETVSDREGRFELRGLGEGPYRVRSSAPGYGSASNNNANPEADVVLYLFRGVGITGRVTDEKGEPVEGVFVDAEWTGSDIFSRQHVSSTQQTDAEGGFAVLGLEPGRYRLYARHPDYAPSASEATLENRDVEVDLVLTQGVSVTGRLIDANDEPVRGRAALEALDGGSVGRLIESRLGADTDDDGTFTLSGVPRGEHRLRLSARGYGSESVDLYVGGKSPVDIGEVVLEVGIAIRGVVVDADGEGVGDARVQAFKASGSDRGISAQGEPDTETDWEGRFVLAGLEEALYHLMVAAPGYGREVTDVEAGSEAITVALRPAGTIRGSVSDTEGRPIGSFRVLARAPERRGFGGATTGVSEDNGLFVVEDVAEGEYAVEVSAADFVPEVVSNVRVTPGAVTELGEIRLRRGARLRGIVIDTAGAPIAGAMVTVRTPGQRFFSTDDLGKTTDGSGSFEVRGLPDGKVDVAASHPSYAETRLEGIDIDSSSGAKDVELVLRGGGAIEGYVRSRDGTNVAVRTIQVMPLRRAGSMSLSASVQTGTDGSFRIDHLAPGPVEVSLVATSGYATYAVQARQVEIRENETVQVNFDSRQILVQGQIHRAGAPLSGVEIDLWPSEGGVIYGWSQAGVTQAPSSLRYLNARTGEDGFFELLVDAPGEYRVSVNASGAGLPSRNVVVPDLDTFFLDLDFSGVAVSGRVVEEETGEAVVRAFVSARPESSADWERGASTQTGADGRFELELEAGTFTLVARAEGFAPSERRLNVSDSGISEVVLSLTAGLRITGRVSGTGSLRIYAIEDSPDLSTPPMRMSFAMSVADGSFVLDGLARVRYNILAGEELAGFGVATGIPAGTEDVDIALRPAARLDVEVVDGEGTPVDEIAVAIVAVDGHKIRGAQTATDRNGRASLAVPAGSLHVKAANKDELEGIAVVTVMPGGRAELQMVVAPAPSPRPR